MGANAMRLATMATLALLGGCAASIPAAQVTRFHASQPITRGEIGIAPRDAAQGASLEFENYTMSLARELRALGFTVAAPSAHPDLVALIDITRETVLTGPERSPLSIGLGGGTGGGGVGIGGGVSFPIGKATAPEAVRTELFVQIRRHSDDSALWEGRAKLQARSGTPYASPAAAVDKLAAALFRDFPGESGTTITVK